MHPIAEIEAWNSVANGTVDLPADLNDEFRQIVIGHSLATRLGAPEADAQAAKEIAVQRLRHWRVAMVSDATPQQKAVMRVVLRSLELLYREAEARCAG
jgi:hypothetical protein